MALRVKEKQTQFMTIKTNASATTLEIRIKCAKESFEKVKEYICLRSLVSYKIEEDKEIKKGKIKFI